MKPKEKRRLPMKSNNIIIADEKSPPEKLNNPAVTPRVKKVKPALRTTTPMAKCGPKQKRQNMVTILDNPILIPGGIPGTTGIKDSAKESVSAKAKRSPVTATVFAVIFFIRFSEKYP